MTNNRHPGSHHNVDIETKFSRKKKTQFFWKVPKILAQFADSQWEFAHSFWLRLCCCTQVWGDFCIIKFPSIKRDSRFFPVPCPSVNLGKEINTTLKQFSFALSHLICLRITPHTTRYFFFSHWLNWIPVFLFPSLLSPTNLVTFSERPKQWTDSGPSAGCWDCRWR